MSSATSTLSHLELAQQFIENTGKNLFLTGKAGTGKTTFLHQLRANSAKRMVVVAPTGVAAINAGGVTIHSLFQLPFGPQIPYHYFPDHHQAPRNSFRFSREKMNLLRSIDLLVIDEISMVRADLLDAIDGVLRRFRHQSKPFGGVQVLMIGDLQQLAPVVKDEEWQLLQAYYSGPFFFQSIVLQQFPAETIELKHIFRQSDGQFIEVLNQIRENKLTPKGLQILQNRHIPNFKAPKGTITLTSHNRQADKINQSHLDQLSSSPILFNAQIEGDFPESSYPNDKSLPLKKGAQVMFIKNDSSREKLYFNGKIGTIERIIKDTVYVRCSDPDILLDVKPVEWNNYKYTLNNSTHEIEESIVGRFVQHPLKLAWAITIHKSQGLTFDNAIIDANAAFAHGQVYVALSRCRSLEGMVLSSPIDTRSVISNNSVNNFVRNSDANSLTFERIQQFQLEYERELINELFNFSRIDRQLKFLHKEIMQHRRVIFGHFPDILNDILLRFREKIIVVSNKFNPQLTQLLSYQITAEQNHQLQDRLKRASVYFDETITKLLNPLTETIEMETDNQDVQKTIKDQIERILKSFNTHHNCLNACCNGFSISHYLAAKSVSNIDKMNKKSKNVKYKNADTSTSEQPELYNKLRQWRNHKTEELMVAHYMVLHTKTMIDLANKMPASIKELHKIKGFGKRKTEQFGKEILELIQTYRADQGMEEVSLDLTPQPAKVKKSDVPTWLITLKLHRTGLSPQTIAKQRKLAPSTIESHLAQAISKRELDIHSVLDQQKIETIAQWFKTNKSYSLTAAKTALGNKHTFGELKMVLASLRIQNQ